MLSVVKELENNAVVIHEPLLSSYWAVCSRRLERRVKITIGGSGGLADACQRDEARPPDNAADVHRAAEVAR